MSSNGHNPQHLYMEEAVDGDAPPGYRSAVSFRDDLVSFESGLQIAVAHSLHEYNWGLASDAKGNNHPAGEDADLLRRMLDHAGWLTTYTVPELEAGIGEWNRVSEELKAQGHMPNGPVQFVYPVRAAHIAEARVRARKAAASAARTPGGEMSTYQRRALISILNAMANALNCVAYRAHSEVL